MKILVLTFYYTPDLCAGSFRASAFINLLKKKLSKKDSIDIITTMPNRYHSYLKKAHVIERNNNISIRRISLPSHQSGFVDQTISFIIYFFVTLKLIYKNDYDVVYATSSRLFTAFLGAVVARIKGIYLYLDIRDIFTDTIKSLLGKKSCLLIPFFSLIEKFTIQSAERINLVSKGFESYFKNICPHTKYSYFTNGIDDEFLNISFKKKQPCESKIITYAGNIGQGQGIENIIPGIAKQLEKGFEFWIVGDGGMRERLTEELKKKDVCNVKLFNPVNRNKLISIYRQSDYLFLHLNDYPAFEKVLPSKIFEYAITGKPILAGVNGFARKFISENLDNFMLFNPCNPNDFLEEFRNFNPSKKVNHRFADIFSRNVIMDKMADDFLSERFRIKNYKTIK